MGYGALREASIKKKGGCKCCWSTIEMKMGQHASDPANVSLVIEQKMWIKCR
jgi:hypothetical protein